ncbi:type II toxin-antitoxin system HicB family antitoxin [Candidatus Kuenenbacteria bacterium]|nr:type II toxin-antitoxin system HicB family antitoxin [Candidatus Kuenenbacteria bacterium]
MNIKQQKFHYNIVFRVEPEGGFTAIVPSLPGCITYGKNLKEAKTMALDAIEGYIISLEKHKEFIPSDEETFITTVALEKVSFKKPIFAYV